MKIKTADRLILSLLALTLLVSGLYYYFKTLPARNELDKHTRYTIAEIRSVIKPKKQEWTFLYVYSVNGEYYSGTGTIPLINEKEYKIGGKILIRFSSVNKKNSEPLYHSVSDTLKPPHSGWKKRPIFLLEK